MWKHYCAILTAVIFWGASYLATALAYETIAPLQLGFVRAAISAALFFAWRKAAGLHEQVNRADLARIALSGLFGQTLYFAFQNVGLAWTSSSRAALVVGCYPAIVLLLECIAGRRMPAPLQAAGIAVTVVGVTLLTSAAGEPGQLKGDLLLVVPAVMWWFFSLTTRSLATKYSVSLLTAFQMLFGAAFFAPLALFEGRPWMMPTLESGAAIAFLAVCCSLLSFLFYNYALTGIPVAAAAVLLNLCPVVGVVCSFLALGETVTLRQCVGGAVIVAGVLLSTSRFAEGRRPLDKKS